MAIYINTVNGSVNDIHDNTININVNNTDNAEVITENTPCTDITKAQPTDMEQDAKMDEPEQQTPTPAPPPSDFELEDSVVYLEKPQIGITKEVSKSRVRTILLAGVSKKAILEELFTLHNKNINLFKLGQEERLQWLNSLPSNFQGDFKQSDLKYYREMKGDDEPRRRTR